MKLAWLLLKIWRMRFIDLSLIISSMMDGVQIEAANTLEKDGWNATTLNMFSHSGTHVDAPKHFGVSDESIDLMPLDRFTAQAWMVDCSTVGPKGIITPDHLGHVKDSLKGGEGLIFKTGWSARWGTSEYRDALPRISEALARWIVDHNVKLIGVEPPSVADVNNLEEVTRIHKILLGGGVTIVEGLTNLEEIREEKVWLMALPLKIKDGDGCPARAIAIERT
jgi:arylformamidase